MVDSPLSLDPRNMTSSPMGYVSPAQLASIYEYSNLLQKHSMQPIKHWTQGLARVAEAGVGGLTGRRADEMLAQHYKDMANLYRGISRDITIPGTPGTPYMPPADATRTSSTDWDFSPSRPADPKLVAGPPLNNGSPYGGLSGWKPGERPMGFAMPNDMPATPGLMPDPTFGQMPNPRAMGAPYTPKMTNLDLDPDSQSILNSLMRTG